MSTQVEKIFDRLRREIHGSLHCPTGKSLGEVCIIVPDGDTPCKQFTTFLAIINLWDDSFNNWRLLRDWLVEEGASDILIRHVIYDEVNGEEDGRGPGGRSWNVNFILPKAGENIRPLRSVPFAIVQGDAT